jgi:tetratricopeptide (TPR) repeat protein
MYTYQDALKVYGKERVERLMQMPELPGAAYHIGLSYLKQNEDDFFEKPDYEEAIKWFTRALENRKDSIANMRAPVGNELEWNLAYALMMPSQRRNLNLANKIMSSLHPYSWCNKQYAVKAIVQRGSCLRMLRKHNEAEKFFSEWWEKCLTTFNSFDQLSGWRNLNKEIYRTLLWKYNGDVNHPEIAKRNFDMRSCLGVFLNYVIGKTSVQERLDIIANYFPSQKGKLYPSGMDDELKEMFDICKAVTGNKEIIKKYDDAFNCVKHSGGPHNIYQWRDGLKKDQYFVAAFLLAKGVIKQKMLHQHAFKHPTDVWRALAWRGHPICMLSLAKFGEDREYWEENAHLYGGPKLWSISI